MLECLQKALRIANSATEEIVTVQLYCETLDQYLYYFDRGVNAVRPDSKTVPLFWLTILDMVDCTQIYCLAR